MILINESEKNVYPIWRIDQQFAIRLVILPIQTVISFIRIGVITYSSFKYIDRDINYSNKNRVRMLNL